MKTTRIVVLTKSVLHDWRQTFDREEIARLAPWLGDSIDGYANLELYLAWAQMVGWKLVGWSESPTAWIVTLSGETSIDPSIEDHLCLKGVGPCKM